MIDPTTTRELTYAEAIREGLRQAMQRDDRVFILGEDIGVYGGAFGVTGDLVHQFGPERVLDTPISELGIAGAAIGAQPNKPAIGRRGRRFCAWLGGRGVDRAFAHEAPLEHDDALAKLQDIARRDLRKELVEAALALEDLLHGGMARTAVADVQVVRHGAGFSHLVQPLEVDVGDVHAGTRRHERGGDGAADALRRARDKGYAVVEVEACRHVSARAWKV